MPWCAPCKTPAGDPLDTPEVIRSEQRFRGKILGLRVDTLAAPDGTAYTREIVEYGVAVVLVPVDAAGCLLMVRQYRHAAKAWLLELPAGGVDQRDASPEAAALRELREETGHRGTLTRIGGMFLAPGYSEEYQHVYVASGLVEDPLAADDDEDLVLERVTLDDALSRVDHGQIRDAKSIAALLMYLRHLGRA
ncbi:MAG TPA: NUDIX hydrolase [Dehalococcoidia bacterium]|nr:NUDIX hydrolase [Dehalococcoidia bacterium]